MFSINAISKEKKDIIRSDKHTQQDIVRSNNPPQKILLEVVSLHKRYH